MIYPPQNPQEEPSEDVSELTQETLEDPLGETEEPVTKEQVSSVAEAPRMKQDQPVGDYFANLNELRAK